MGTRTLKKGDTLYVNGKLVKVVEGQCKNCCFAGEPDYGDYPGTSAVVYSCGAPFACYELLNNDYATSRFVEIKEGGL